MIATESNKPWQGATKYEVVLEGVEFKNGKTLDQTIGSTWIYFEAKEAKEKFLKNNPRFAHYSIVIKAIINEGK